MTVPFYGLNTESVEEFATQFGVDRQNKRAERRHAWQLASISEQYAQSSPVPTQAMDFYAADPTKQNPYPDLPTPLAPAETERLHGVYDDIVNTIETAFAENPETGAVDLSVFLKYDINDLRMLQADELGINLDWLASRQFMTAAHEDFIKRVEDETDLRYEARVRGNDWQQRANLGSDRVMDFLNPFGDNPFGRSARESYDLMVAQDDLDREEVRNEVWLEFTGQRDQLFETEISEWRDKRREQIQEETVADRKAGALGLQHSLSLADLETLASNPRSGFSAEQLKAYEGIGRDRQRVTEAMEQTLAEEEAMYRELIIAGGDPAELFDQRGAFGNIVSGTLSGLGWGIDKLATGVGGALWAVDGVIPGSNVSILSPYDYFVRRQKEGQADSLRQYETEVLGQNDDEVLYRALHVQAEIAWEEQRQGNTETYQELLNMASGDEILAAGLFTGAILDSPEVLEAEQQIIGEVRNLDEKFMEDLREQDFRFSHEVMDILSMWGRNGPGRVSTAVTLLITDQDYWDDLTAGEFRKTWNEVGEHASQLGFTPSSAVGIDGSMAGLALDFGMGIILDPSTYFLGPKFLGAAKGAALGTIDNAAYVARSAPVRAMVDDVINFAQSPSRNSNSLWHVMSWLDDTAMGEILSTTGLVDDVLPARPWAANPRGAQEVSTSFLRRLIPDEAAGALDDVTLQSLSDDILAKGFEEALEVTLSRADDTLTFTDGVKRALAAERSGISRVPVRLRIVDEAAAGNTIVDGFNAAESSAIKTIAGGGAASRASQSFAQVVKGADLEAWGALKIILRHVDDRIPGTSVGQVTNKAGDIFEVLRSESEGGVWYAIKQGDEIVGGVSAKAGRVMDETEGINMGLDDVARGTMEQVWDLAREHGDELILQSGLSRSISENALSFVQKYASKLLDDAAENLGRPGTSLDDLLEGKQLKRATRPFAEGVGEVVTRPDMLLPGELLLGKVDKASIMSSVEQAIVQRGVRPSDGARISMHTSLPGRVRQAMTRAIPSEIRSFFTQANLVTRIDLHGMNVTKDILVQATKMWGDDIGKANEWTQRFLNHKINAAKKVRAQEVRQAALLPQRLRIERLMELNGGGIWDDTLKQVNDLVDAGDVTREAADSWTEAARAQSQLIDDTFNAELKTFERAMRQIQKDLGALPDQSDLARIVQEMWEDFNRTKIVPRWKKEIAKSADILDPELGIVKWEHLKKMSSRSARKRSVDDVSDDFFSETMQNQAAAEDVTNAEKLYRMLNSVPDTPMALNLPMSPLDMIAASSASGSKWIKWNQMVSVEAVKNGALALQKAWIIDKVLRPATAATVSGDELLRIFHKGGRWAVARYMGDRALYLQARLANARHAGRGNSATQAFFARDAVRQGAKHSQRVQQRLQRLDEWTVRAREWERIFYDDHGIGWTDIYPDDPTYLTAAKQWSANFMQQSGFRAFLRGEDAFRDWFFSVDGAQLRDSTVLKKVSQDAGASTGIMGQVDQAYLGWQTVFEKVIMATAKGDGVLDDMMDTFRETARMIDESGGRPIDMPDWVYEHLGPIRGVQKHNRSSLSPLQLTDAFFDRFFLDPVNYRRGFVADMVAQQEKARLTALLQSQGHRIVTDTELANVLGVKGMAGAVRTGVKDWMTAEGLRRKLVPQSYIDDMVQKAALEEMDHMLYVAERGSRAGRAAQAVFPFGKPYADMMAFWGREMLRRPHYRGQAIERNVLGALDGGFGTGMGDATKLFTRFNPRTPALVSRLAHTDFLIDRGWDGGLFSDLEEGETAGLLPGSEQTSLAPLAFLPTGGENPFYSMIPGMGYIPMWALDRVLSSVVDPIEDPLAYQELLDNVGDVIGGAHFGSPDPGLSAIQRILGGGTFGQITETALDVSRLFGDSGAHPFASTLLGQPDREIDRGRYASAILADPEEWITLLELEDEESIGLYIDSLALEADQNAATGNLSEQITRFALPANNKYSGDLDTIWEVWLEAGQAHTVLGGDPNFDSELASPEQRKQYAGDIRSTFFDLPQWQRDALVAQTPQLAVNLVSSWTWTDLAFDRGIDGTENAYRTSGDRDSLARHQLYVEEGIIRPLAPQERLRRIVGLALSSKESASKGVYESMARNVNEVIWQVAVTDEDKAALDAFYSIFEEQWVNLDVRSSQELWSLWGTYEERAEDMIADALGVDKVRGESTRKDDRTEYDNLRRSVKIEQSPWSTTWPGLNPEELSSRMADFPVLGSMLTEDVVAQAESVGIELTPGMTGAQLYGAVQMRINEINPVLLNHVDPAYQSYIGNRTSVDRVLTDNLRAVAFNQNYSEEWRQVVDDFITFESSMSKRWREAPLGMPPEEQLAVQDRFMTMMQGADDNVVTDWAQLWEKGFERNYGPLGWEPPEPRHWQDEDGSTVEGAYQPYIHHLIDGDSLVVRNAAHGPWHEVRLLGVRAADYGLDDPGADADKDRLWDALQQAKANGDSIYLVRDSGDFGNVDIYGRELAWLWIGDEPFYFADEMLPNRDPSGGDE